MFAKVKPNTQFIGQNIIYFNQVDSTNTFAIELMKQNMAKDGTVVVAEFQGKGRGQSKNVWISEAFENLLFSIVLKPATCFSVDLFSLNKTIAVSIYSVLREFLPQNTVHIKWPNDILIERRKVAGILIENNFIGNKLNWSIAGIGLNVNQKFEHLTEINASSLSEITGNTIEREHILKLILEIKQKAQHRSYRTYTEYDFNSKFNDYKKEYKKEQPKEDPKVKSTGNPRLDKINEKIVLREEQLRKMKANDPERQSLVNELETYKNVAKKMKSKIK